MVTKKQYWCGFCGKAQEDVDRLISGPCIEVCNECIDAMHQLVHAPRPLLPIKHAAKPRTVIPFNEEARKRGQRRR